MDGGMGNLGQFGDRQIDKPGGPGGLDIGPGLDRYGKTPMDNMDSPRGGASGAGDPRPELTRMPMPGMTQPMMGFGEAFGVKPQPGGMPMPGMMATMDRKPSTAPPARPIGSLPPAEKGGGSQPYLASEKHKMFPSGMMPGPQTPT